MNKGESESEAAERRAAEEEFLRRQRDQSKLSSVRRSSLPEVFLGEGSSRLPQSGARSIAGSESEADTNSSKRSREKLSPERNRPKKKKNADGMESDDDEEDEEMEDPLANLSAVLKKLREWVVLPALVTKVSKPMAAKFGRIMARFEEQIALAREERARIETKIAERAAVGGMVRDIVQEEVKKIRVEMPVQPKESFAEILRADAKKKVPPVTGVNGPVKPAPKRVIVRHEEKGSEEVEATLKSLVQPSKIGLKVKKLIKIRNGVIVEAEDELGAANLAKQDALRQAGLKVERPEKKKPFIMVYDVRKDLTEEEIREEIFSKNVQESHIKREEFDEEFKVKHRYRDSRSEGRLSNLVVECSVRVRNMLRDKERIFIEWQSCRVKDYIDVPRCYKCQRHGHIAKYCASAKVSCSYCAGEHDHKECQEKNNKEKVCCANCQREGKQDMKHDAGWKKCPAYQVAAKRYNERIDYGIESI